MFPTVIEAGSPIRVKFTEPSNQGFNLSILDLHGKLVKSFFSNPGEQEATLSLNELKSGMYLVQISRECRMMNKKGKVEVR